VPRPAATTGSLWRSAAPQHTSLTSSWWRGAPPAWGAAAAEATEGRRRRRRRGRRAGVEMGGADLRTLPGPRRARVESMFRDSERPRRPGRGGRMTWTARRLRVDRLGAAEWPRLILVQRMAQIPDDRRVSRGSRSTVVMVVGLPSRHRQPLPAWYQGTPLCRAAVSLKVVLTTRLPAHPAGIEADSAGLPWSTRCPAWRPSPSLGRVTSLTAAGAAARAQRDSRVKKSSLPSVPQGWGGQDDGECQRGRLAQGRCPRRPP